MHPDKLEKLGAAYLQGLTQAHARYPEDYAWPVEGIPAVHKKMMAAIVEGSYNHNSHGFRLACKALGIKHTRKAIADFLAS